MLQVRDHTDAFTGHTGHKHKVTQATVRCTLFEADGWHGEGSRARPVSTAIASIKRKGRLHLMLKRLAHRVAFAGLLLARCGCLAAPAGLPRRVLARPHAPQDQ